MDLRIRLAKETDLPALQSIKRDAGNAAWPHILPLRVLDALPFPDRWVAGITSDDPRVGIQVAELGGQVVGFEFTRPSGDADAAGETGELDGFYVDPRSWGLGAAAEIHRPRRIYETAGWRTDGTDRRRAFSGVEFVEVRYRIRLSS